MSEPTNKQSILDMARGAIKEKPQLLKWFHRFQDNNHLMEMKKTSQKYYG